MDLQTARRVQKQILSHFKLGEGDQRRGPRPQVAFGFAPGPAGGFQTAIRARSRTDFDKALGKGAFDQVQKMSFHEVDVQYTGIVEAAPVSEAPQSSQLGIGASVGRFYSRTAGSLGFFARHKKHSIGFVSNNHVIADCDNGQEGDEILHPAPMDGGRRPNHVIGQLAGPYPHLRQNGSLVDAAFASLRDDIEYDCSRIGPRLRLLPESAPLIEQRDVLKFGRSTGLTAGRISAFALQNLYVDYPAFKRKICFNRQIEIASEDEQRPFSKPGDSGSLVVNPAGNPVGLLFARSGDGRFSYANPIDDVLRELEVTLLA